MQNEMTGIDPCTPSVSRSQLSDIHNCGMPEYNRKLGTSQTRSKVVTLGREGDGNVCSKRSERGADDTLGELLFAESLVLISDSSDPVKMSFARCMGMLG